MGTHFITVDCTTCATCVDACPLLAITDEGEIPVINAETCIDCGACEEACPFDAIKWQ